MVRVLVLNGPNMNLLGRREPEVYGSDTLADIEGRLRERASSLGCGIAFHQTNHEGELIDRLHAAADAFDAVVLNPGGYAHTSVALRDAVASIGLPVVEVHLSNIHAREPYRRRSLVAEAARGCIVGLGALGYELALEAAVRLARGKTA